MAPVAFFKVAEVFASLFYDRVVVELFNTCAPWPLGVVGKRSQSTPREKEVNNGDDNPEVG